MLSARHPAVKALLTASVLLGFVGAAHAQYLFWRPKDDQGSYRCVYGEITVLATAPTTYFCGLNWWPSCPAGGYTGIQDIDGAKHAMIFSIWDTTSELHSAAVEEGDPRTVLSRFGGEGEGGKSMLPYNWQVGKTYRFFVFKRQDKAFNRTLASTYFFDDELGRWVYEATIASPNNGDKCVAGFGGMLNAFVENWSGQDKSAPRIATYRLWVGTTPANLTPVTEADGKGMWGVLNDSFYLASGDPSVAMGLVDSAVIGDGIAVRGADKRLSVSARAVPLSLVKTLQTLLGPVSECQVLMKMR
jgi:hypothetical protein